MRKAIALDCIGLLGGRSADGRGKAQRRWAQYKSVRDDAGAGVCAQTAEIVRGKTIPLGGGIESVRRIGVSGADGGFASQCIIGGGGEACTPFGTGVEADLADDIHDGATGAPFAEDDGVISVVPGAGVRLVDKGRGGKACGGLCKHKNAIGGYCACQCYGVAGCGGSVEIHLYHIVAGGEVDGTARSVVELEGFVIAAAFHILGDKDVSGRL